MTFVPGLNFDNLTLPRFPGYGPGQKLPIMRPEGSGRNRVWLVGEALGYHESAERLPFRPHADAGGVLERAIRRSGHSRQDFVISNAVWYRPPDNRLSGESYELEAIELCRPFQDEVFAKFRPKVILALGATAFRDLTGICGPKRGIEQVRGFIVDSPRYGLPVIGTYHPSYLRRGSKEKSKETGAKTEAAGGAKGMALLGVLMRDLQLAVDIAQKGRSPKPSTDGYVLGATLRDWELMLSEAQSDPSLVISYDFETRDSLAAVDEAEAEHLVREITQVQVSLRIGHALVSPWTSEIGPILKVLLELPNPKLDWNGRGFDRPLLRDLGIRTDLGPWHDGMDLWHHSQPDLPRGLQFAASFYASEVGPWKHLSHSDELLYGAYDVDVPQRIFAGLRVSLSGQREPHSGRSMWDGYEETVRKTSVVLDNMSKRGIPVDADRSRSLDNELAATQTKVLARIQQAIPEDLCDWKQKSGLKKRPRGMPTEGIDGRWTSPDGKVYLERVVSEDGELRWGQKTDFNPNSSPQILKYIRWQREKEIEKGVPVSRLKWKVPTKFRSTDETTGFKELVKLAKLTGDQVLLDVREIRNLGKFRGTYIAGWAPGPDGRVHPFFGTKPATGQLSSTNPNAQNFPKHSDLAIRMRGMIKPMPGKVLVECDFKSFHVLTLGFEAQDPSYMRMARLDMHSFFAAAGLLRLSEPEKLLELSDAELMARLKAWRADDRKLYPGPKGELLTFAEVRDEQAKRTILGYGFGMGPARLYHENEETIGSKVKAQQLIQALDRLFPVTAKFRQDIRQIADRQGYLLSRHGCVRRFYSVFDRRPVETGYSPGPGESCFVSQDGQLWVRKPGDDSEAAIAFLPANDAFGVIKAAMVELEMAGLAEKYGLINQIHDALVLEVEKAQLDNCLSDVSEAMQKPSEVLVDPTVAPTGLSCEVEAMVGESWDQMRKVSLK